MRKSILTLIISALVCLNSFGAEESAADSIQTKTLDEFVVKGNKKIVKNEGPKTTILISGTPYGNYLDLTSMLNHLPGMMPSGSGPEVIGAGTPIYFVDGRELKDVNELRAIQPSDIKDIEINRIPPIDQSPNGAPVVRITLKKNANDYIFLNAGIFAQQLRNFGIGGNLTLKYKYKKFSTSLFASESSTKSEIKESYKRSIFHDEYDTFTNQYRDLLEKYTGTIVRYIAEYKFNPNSYIGLYYNFHHAFYKPTPFGNNSIVSKDIMQKWDYSAYGNNINNTNNFTLMWLFFGNKFTFRLTQDVLLRNSHNNKTSTESAVEAKINKITNSSGRSDYQAYTTNAQLWLTKLPWGIAASTGIRYDRVNNNSTSSTFDDLFDYTSRMKVHEDNASAYISLSKSFGRVLIRPDLNYVYTFRNISSRSAQDPTSVVKQHYSTFTPRVYIQWNPSNDWTAYGQYRRSISQPGFKALNSGLIYKDQWEWSDGNPDLKAEISNYYQLGFSWKSLAGSVSYNDIKNTIVTWEKLMKPDGDAIAQLSVNLPHTRYWFAELSYGNQIGKVNYYAAFNAMFPHYKMLIRDKEVVRNKPNFFANANISYQLNSHFSFTTTYTWSGPGYDVPLVYRHSWQRWDIGVQAKLLKNKLSISLDFQDLLKTANYSNNKSWFNNISYEVSGRSDFRGVLLRVSYTFFNKKINTSTANGNDEIKNRIIY